MKLHSLIAAALMSAAALLFAVQSQGQPAPAKPLRYMIVVTGGELLEGVYPDAHTPFLTRTLRPLGAQCAGSMTVDDNREDIQRALGFCTNLVPLVIVTGGLGPTPNDITRETISECTGIPLREESDLLADMARRFNQPPDQVRPNLRRQTLIPSRGGFLRNPAGTAAGLVFDLGSGVVVALPGPPRELQPMVREALLPLLRQRFGVRDFGSALTLRFVGAGQSLIDQTIKDHVSVAPDVVITSLFEGSRVDFTFSLPGNTPADRERLKLLESRIREHLDPYIYADDGSSLEDVIVRKLRAGGGSLALAEVGSGGALAAALSGAKETAQLLAAAFAAPSEEALARVLGLEFDPAAVTAADRARQLALSASKRCGSQWAVAVGGIDSDEKGARGLCVAFQQANKCDVERIPLRDSGEITRATLTTQILDFLRHRLQ